MPIQLRLIETTISRGHSDLTIDVQSPDQAAAIVARAHRKSMTAGSPVIKLPNGHHLIIDQGVPEISIEMVLLDGAGQEVRPIEVPKAHAVRAEGE